METSEPTSPPSLPARKATLRFGQRELSLLSAAVVLVVGLGVLFGTYKMFRSFKAQRDIVIAQSNLKALHTALLNYAQDWDGRFPPADRWTDAVQGYLSAPPGTPGGAASYLQGPGDNGTLGYVYNELAAGYNLEPTRDDNRQEIVSPNRLVVLIEQQDAPRNAHILIPPQGSAQGEKELLKNLQFPHYADDAENAATVLLFASGNIARQIRRDYR